jgi:hypothetical protein
MELVVEDTPFHRLESNSIPPGYAEVDAKVSDADGLFDCTMVAGMIGTRITSS